MRWRRPLFLFHRWAGIVLCLFFALWFFSGIFMMYVEFPQLTKLERLRGSQPLDFTTAKLTAAQAVERTRLGDFATHATPSALLAIDVPDPYGRVTPKSIRLGMVLNRPAYFIHPDNGAQPRVVFADSGEVLRDVSPAAALESVLHFVQRRGAGVRTSEIAYLGSIQTDQWSVSSALNDHRPLLRYALNDPDGTELYVSSRTGEVVRDTHRRERLLNYFGAVTHWLYPTFIRKYPELWEWVVDILSSAGVVLAISGLWVGLLRWNRNAGPGKPRVPYRGIMRWHYFTGIVFGTVTVTWVMSGLLSMNPLSLNPPRRPALEQTLVYAGKPVTPSDFGLPSTGFGATAIQADLIHYDGQAFYRVTDRDGRVRLVAGNDASTRLPSVDAMIARASGLMPNATPPEIAVLTAYDNYYYSRHPERAERELPVIRASFSDAQRTWFHLDPVTGQIIERSTRTNRVFRWLYNGLHSLDIWWLYQRRPLWDICVITLSVGGFSLSMLGVVIGWRRLHFKRDRAASVRVSDRSTEPSIAVR